MAAIIDKAELKRSIIQEIGKELDKKREAAEHEVYRLDGGRSALTQSATKITEHSSYWQKDFDEDKCTKEELEAALKAINHCAGIVRNLAEVAVTAKLIKQGELAAFDKSSGVCEKMFEVEGQKAQAFLDAIERGELTTEGLPTDKAVAGERTGGRPPLRAIGQHPGANVAQVRKQKEAGAKTQEALPAVESKDAVSPSATVGKEEVAASNGNGKVKGNGEAKAATKEKPSMPPARRRRKKSSASKVKS